ncbi:leucyl aminopeptidase [Candidatus Finniella inopinata]|uniref:Probable cytosol aminopeptidase n=1 Tax=Candidatus Finniella inopinata TaxID=1696036 RepID=A0A4Q7DK44_9PROT|nr:leucyl aminopeptidase [Candidatus Finniella inopinata]RZI46555.1 leucyl aminopeptidase [Candidatus Finniella inopinata]
MKISFSSTVNLTQQDCLVIGMFEEADLASPSNLINLDFVRHALKTTAFKGKKAETLSLVTPADMKAGQVLVIGLGKAEKVTEQVLQEVGAKAISTLEKSQAKRIVVDIHLDSFGKAGDGAAHMAAGAQIRHWKFDLYKTQKKDTPCLDEFTFVTQHPHDAEKLFSDLSAISEGVALTRHVVSEPPNVLYPETMAQKALELETLGIKVEVLGEKDMEKLGMGALLGVGQGSIRESKLIVLQWLNGPKDEAPVAIVGKGVTFDSGGISIKPSNGMEDMKYDMAGSGVVLGMMKALATRQAKVNVVGIMGMVENMPSGSAQRPADVVTSMSGQTIEVVNTDAEGRLVLADALWYTQDRFKPKAMINLATLTGAIKVALGEEYAGLFSNNDELSEKLTKAGKTVQEQLWRLPMGEAYDRDIDSEIADMKNVGSGRGAGSTTAAQFLQRFVNNVPWAHLDIASVAWLKKDHPLTGKGATAFGVRLLNTFIKQNYE